MENKIIIKIAEVSDSKFITQILNAAFQEFKSRYTPKAFEATVISPEAIKERMKDGLVWIVTINNEPLGTVSAKIKKDSCYIQSMAVAPKGRGKKIGYLLLQPLEAYAKKNNCKELLLSTTPFLKKAIHLYEKFGFQIINNPPYHLHKTPLFTMKKLL